MAELEVDGTETIEFDEMASSYIMQGTVLEHFTLFNGSEVVYQGESRRVQKQAKDALNTA